MGLQDPEMQGRGGIQEAQDKVGTLESLRAKAPASDRLSSRVIHISGLHKFLLTKALEFSTVFHI